MVVYSLEKDVPLPPDINSDPERIDEYLKQCGSFRIKYPGFCASEFQNLHEIVIEHVLGWNRKEGKSKEEGGAFGKCLGWYSAVEEQERKSLHCHFLLWLDGWNELLQKLYSDDLNRRRAGENELATYVDHILSNKLFGIPRSVGNENDVGGTNVGEYYNSCHECMESDDGSSFEFRPCPVQKLRNMRYKFWPKSAKQNRSVVSCTKCSAHFDTTDLLRTTLNKLKGTDIDDGDCENFLRLLVLRDQVGLSANNSKVPHRLDLDEARTFVVAASKNVHDTRHKSSCFKHGCSCRFNIPNRPSDATKVHFFDEHKLSWCTWDGRKHERSPFFVEPSRHPMDVFMNNYHPLTSNLFGSNSNVQVGIDGAHIMYCTCYSSKTTRVEDKQTFVSALEGLVRRIKAENRRIEADMGYDLESPHEVGFRRMLASILSSTSGYVVSATLAKYIMVNGSRFQCSHNFAGIPLYSLLNSDDMSEDEHARLKTTRKKFYVSSKMNDYLFRPIELEDVAACEFYATYECVRVRWSKKGRQKSASRAKKQASMHSTNIMGKEEILRYSSKKHPSYNYQGVRKRAKKMLPLVWHDVMIDAKRLIGSLESPATEDHYILENYSKKILCLFMPFRSLVDLQINGSYREKLLQCRKDGSFSPCYFEYLRNMQGVRNSLDSGRLSDVLERTTEPLLEPTLPENKKKKKQITLPEEVKAFLDMKLGTLVTEINQELLTAAAAVDEKKKDWNIVNSEILRKRGSFQCGVDKNIGGAKFTASDRDIIEVDKNRHSNCNSPLTEKPNKRKRKRDDISTSNITGPGQSSNIRFPLASLVKLYTKSTRRNIQNTIVTDLDNIIATGSPKSIREWSHALFADDLQQKRAFEVIVSEFVLSVLRDSVDSRKLSSNEDDENVQRSVCVKWKMELIKLRGLPSSHDRRRLVMLMTGSGGSGKSYVIKSVLAYAKQFCAEMREQFDKFTIVVSALTGVAAASILGETIHSVIGLNGKGRVKSNLGHDQELVNNWKRARLIIVDEISLASKKLLIQMDEALRILKNRPNDRYGGLSVIFVGDFYQLEPINGLALYLETSFDKWFDWINGFIELKGKHRFAPEYGVIMERLREGKMTSSDFDVLDRRVVGENENGLKVPNGTCYACVQNNDRVAFNHALFLKHLEQTHFPVGTDRNVVPPRHTIVVKSSFNTLKETGGKLSPSGLRNLWENCGDHNVHAKRGFSTHFFDPLLKLYIGAPVMLVVNKDVAGGLANGTVGFIEAIVLTSDGEQHLDRMSVDGYHVMGIESRYVSHIRVRKEDGTIYRLEPEFKECLVDMSIKLSPELPSQIFHVPMFMMQFPIVVNHATTVNKLQGQTKQHVFVNGWRNIKNWAYVALSRVTHLDGLFLRKKLDRNRNYRPHSLLIRMMKYFKTKAPIQGLDESC